MKLAKYCNLFCSCFIQCQTIQDWGYKKLFIIKLYYLNIYGLRTQDGGKVHSRKAELYVKIYFLTI